MVWARRCDGEAIRDKRLKCYVTLHTHTSARQQTGRCNNLYLGYDVNKERCPLPHHVCGMHHMLIFREHALSRWCLSVSHQTQSITVNMDEIEIGFVKPTY